MGTRFRASITDEVLAMAAESGLLEESRNEFVIFDFEDVLLSESAPSIKSNKFLLSLILARSRGRGGG